MLTETRQRRPSILSCEYRPETCEGMLSLNNGEIRPEVACATPLSGKADTRCRHRRAKMVNNCCVVFFFLYK